jgi:peptide deformylase
MTLYRIRYIGDPILKRRAEDITVFDEKLKSLVSKMFEIMYEEDGIGLAAPQIGLSIRLFVTDVTSLDENGTKKAYINPEIINTWGESTIEEGCLSVPNVREDVVRPSKIEIKYMDEKGKQHIEILDNWPARVAQHENDHLDGILFVDRISPMRRKILQLKRELPITY